MNLAIELNEKRIYLYLIIDSIVAAFTGVYAIGGEILRYRLFCAFVFGMCIATILLVMSFIISREKVFDEDNRMW